jgi:cytochrome P450
LYEIAKSKDVQRKICEEVDRVLDGKDPTYDDIPQLEYINACIKECLRLHPPVTGTVKASVKDDEIEGYHIPKGTVMLIPIYGTHYNDQNYEDPLKFIPDRFLKDDHQEFSVTYLPFSFGSRRCVGKTFSYVETAIIIAKIFQDYSVSFEDGTPDDFKPEELVIITCKIRKLNLVLKKRNPIHVA